MSEVDAMTYVGLVQRIGAARGFTVTAEQADEILWEHTGFPGFFRGDPLRELKRQVRAFFREARRV